MSEINILSADELRVIEELKGLSLKEKSERAVANGILIHNLEYQAKHFNQPLTDQHRALIAKINREMDIIMKDPDVRYYFENEIKDGGTPIIYTPN